MRVIVVLILVVYVNNVALEQPITTQKEDPSPREQHFFLDEIFDKYGHEGVMSFEGFEHLLESLGLGQLEFKKDHDMSLHRVNGTFKEVHDDLDLHQHHHRRPDEEDDRRARGRRAVDHVKGDYQEALVDLESDHPDQEVTIKAMASGRCLSPQDILLTFGLEPHHALVINPLRFLKLCPAIVYELDQRSCYQAGDSQGATINTNKGPASMSAWLYASLSVLLISVMGLLGVAVVPLVQKAFYKQFLQFLVALAVGTLCGDALLHLLPHSLATEPDDHITPVLRATVTFLALVFFFIVEIVIRYLTSSNAPKQTADEVDGKRDTEMGPMLRSKQHQHGHQHNSEVSSVAWMVIMGDGLHNLTDGLAIGAAFSGDTVAGFATTLAVFCHELPHEIGDFAVLLKSGMSVRRALCYNVFSSVLSFTGMAIGVWIGDHGEAAMWIFAATAGTFLYISLADLIPEMNNVEDGPKTLVDILLQVMGIMTGGGIMLTIALYEDNLRKIFNETI